MSELDQLKKRIDDSGASGVDTEFIRDDYDPIGDLLIYNLLGSEEYVQRKVPLGATNGKWKMFKKSEAPY